ncbi:MAG: site-specific DNA-methyltransferase [Chloroflexi bacterium]|nr:site-specific DNA-methyltransferase [Chloroflexota bacterium]MBP8058780.1 site-specific DNA-methyltransferase [Chloroflexota bacterium]
MTTSKRSLKPRANDLDGKVWVRHSISIWSDIRKTAEEQAMKHPAMFPQSLAERLIQTFTNQAQTVVLDPFAGTGSTLAAAKTLHKTAIGVELYPRFVTQIQERAAAAVGNGTITIHQANAVDLRQFVPDESVDFVLTSPPYWDILTARRTADYKDIRNYGDEDGDLGLVKDYQAFLGQLQQVFAQVYQVLKPRAYCCVVVMDIRKKNRFYPFHSDLAGRLQDLGFVYDDLIIWDRRQEYNNMRPLGYPAVFRVNKAHEFILIFQKPGI